MQASVAMQAWPTAGLPLFLYFFFLFIFSCPRGKPSWAGPFRTLHGPKTLPAHFLFEFKFSFSVFLIKNQ
jgi:hypothetical protein